MARSSKTSAAGKKTPPSKAAARADGRRSLLVYLEPNLIKALKKAAVDSDRHGYEIVEESLRNWFQSAQKN